MASRTRVVSAIRGLDSGERYAVSGEDCSYHSSAGDPRRRRGKRAQPARTVSLYLGRPSGVVQLTGGSVETAPRDAKLLFAL